MSKGELQISKWAKEESVAKQILIKIITGIIRDDNKKLLNVLLLYYIKSVYRECPDLDSNKIYKICEEYLEKHNFI